MQKNKPTESEQQMFDQVRELCQLTGKACYKIANDTNIPIRLVIRFYMSMMDQLINETDKDVYNNEK